ncbi:hypothetical protein ACE1CM_12520 [Microseira sp. BLCC-F43]
MKLLSLSLLSYVSNNLQAKTRYFSQIALIITDFSRLFHKVKLKIPDLP